MLLAFFFSEMPAEMHVHGGSNHCSRAACGLVDVQ
jgi:hypothetical protein